ncbi:hypothetical protein TCEA9_15590 [Thermobrachium celere]|nr:hypothetical protein TCEA9_15590 [Thermobrachium celere]
MFREVKININDINTNNALFICVLLSKFVIKVIDFLLLFFMIKIEGLQEVNSNSILFDKIRD